MTTKSYDKNGLMAKFFAILERCHFLIFQKVTLLKAESFENKQLKR